MPDAIETVEMDHGVTVELFHDDDPQDPRTEWGNCTTMLCSHPRYTLGDEQFAGVDLWDDPEDGPTTLEEWLREEHDAVLFAPLFLFDHSGLSMSMGEVNSTDVSRAGRFVGDEAGWDTSAVGFIIMTAAQMDEFTDAANDDTARLARCQMAMAAEVRTYDQYLTGDVYGYRVTDQWGDELDSCWGFYGGDYALGEATAAGECAVKSRETLADRVQAVYARAAGLSIPEMRGECAVGEGVAAR